MLIVPGFVMFLMATLSPAVTLPRGPVWIGAGSNYPSNITRTDIYLYDGSFLRFLVRFGRSNSTTFFAYVILPFTVDPNYPPTNSSSDVQYDPISWQNFNGTSAIANITGHIGLPTTLDVTLELELRANLPLFSDTAPLGTRKSLSITFYGDITGIFDDRMTPYMQGPNSTLLYNKQVILYIELPPGTFVSPETFPSPISQYMVNVKGEERKSAIFSLDFLGGTAAQTISCTLINPSLEYSVQIMIFLGGILAATGVYFVMNIIIEYSKEKMSVTKMEYD